MAERFSQRTAAYLPHDYFVVCTRDECWAVSVEMARFVESRLDAFPRPRWIKFVDVTGSRIRLRSDLIEVVYQSSRHQRAASRAFNEARREEREE